MMTRDDGRVASGVAGTAVSPEMSDPHLEAAGLSRPAANARLKALREEGLIVWHGKSSKDPRARWTLAEGS